MEKEIRKLTKFQVFNEKVVNYDKTIKVNILIFLGSAAAEISTGEHNGENNSTTTVYKKTPRSTRKGSSLQDLQRECLEEQIIAAKKQSEAAEASKKASDSICVASNSVITCCQWLCHAAEFFVKSKYFL